MKTLRTIEWWLCLSGMIVIGATTSTSADMTFRRVVIDSTSLSEACALADINSDGKKDVVAGDYYYLAPDWRPCRFADLGTENNYHNSFGNFAMDMDGDDDLDIISGGWFSKKVAWYENPGVIGPLWNEHLIEHGYNVEYLHMVDLDGDGQTDDLLPNYLGKDLPIFWYDLNAGKSPRWKRYQLQDSGSAHGNGMGDVNGDGRNDVLSPKGWLEAPADRTVVPWIFHADWTITVRAAHMWAYDVDADGDNDILYGDGHGYGGPVWMEQRLEAGRRTFTPHMIDDSWSQVHCLFLVDMDHDGDQDLITGKRYYAHNGKDPGAEDPPVIYWYELQRGAAGVAYVRHEIDRGRNGAGFQIVTEDYDHDGDYDIFVGGKKGIYLYIDNSR